MAGIYCLSLILSVAHRGCLYTMLDTAYCSHVVDLLLTLHLFADVLFHLPHADPFPSLASLGATVESLQAANWDGICHSVRNALVDQTNNNNETMCVAVPGKRLHSLLTLMPFCRRWEIQT